MKVNDKALFLDDIRSPDDAFLYGQRKMLVSESKIPNGCWTIKRNYEEFKDFIEKDGVPRVVSLDNDLHPVHYKIFHNAEATGYFDWKFVQPKMGIHCLDFLLNFCFTNEQDIPVLYFHTANSMARKEMEKMVEKSKCIYGGRPRAGVFLPK